MDERDESNNGGAARSRKGRKAVEKEEDVVQDTLIIYYDRLNLLCQLWPVKIDVFEMWNLYGKLATPVYVRAMDERIYNLQLYKNKR